MLLQEIIVKIGIFLLVFSLIFSFFTGNRSNLKYKDEIIYLETISKLVNEKKCNDFLIEKGIERVIGVRDTIFNERFRKSLNCTSQPVSFFYQYNWAKNDNINDYENFVVYLYKNNTKITEDKHLNISFTNLTGDNISFPLCTSDFKQCVAKIEFIK